MQLWYKPHPYGIFPRGNAPPGTLDEPRFGSLSTLSAQLDETATLDLFMEFLTYLNPKDLSLLSATCTGWYSILHASDVWKRVYTLLFPKNLVFDLDWKSSTIRRWSRDTQKTAANAALSFAHKPMCVTKPLFHDLLFQSWMCMLMPPDYKLIKRGVVDLDDTSSCCSSQLDAARPSARGMSADGAARNPITYQYGSKFKSIPKISGVGLSTQDFQDKFESKGIPVIIQSVATEWPFYKILNGEFYNLSRPELFQNGEGSTTPMRCEHTTMTTQEYLHYAREQHDERPIYMFDPEFGSVLRTDIFTVPHIFGDDDFFRAMGSARPKYRWLIAGPHRGGSGYHVDPNFTHAWNACLTGRKRWLLFPPNHPPPGVYPSGDMADVTSPVSLTEWLMNFYSETVTTLKHVGYEGVCEAGEIMFVPAGWWHWVINLEDSVAVTQNYVSKTNLTRVIQFLRIMKSSISGINEDDEKQSSSMTEKRRDSLAEDFVAAMRENFPEELRAAEMEIAEAAEDRRRKRPREHKVELLEPDTEGFTFSF